MKIGWVEKTLEEVTIKTETVDPQKKPNEVFQYVDVSSVSNKTFEIEETSSVLGRDAPSRARKLIKSGDVIFATIRPTLRRIAVVPPDLDGEVCSTGYYVFKTKPELHNKFLYYFLFTDDFMKAMESLQSGASYPAVNDSQVKKQLIPFPDLSEQKRIVAILDAAFAGIDAAIANTEKNLASARELFDSTLNTIFTQKGENYKKVSLGDICDLQNGFVFKSQLFKLEGIPVLRISSIQNEEVCDNRPVFADPKDYKEDLSRYIVDEGKLLIAMSGATTGKVGFNNTGQKFFLNQRVGMFKPSEKININYLFYFLLTKVEENLEIAAGAAQPNLSTKQIKEFQIPLPPKEAQENIVEKLSTLRNEAQNLEAIYQQKLAALNEFKQSLLQKAFRGELTADTKIAEAAE